MLPLPLLSASLAAPFWFYPGPGPERAGVDDALRTGALLVRTDDPRSLALHPDIAAIDASGGDGHVLRVRPRSGVDEVELSRILHDTPGILWAHPDLRIHLLPLAFPHPTARVVGSPDRAFQG